MVTSKTHDQPLRWLLMALIGLVMSVSAGVSEARMADRDRLASFLEVTGFDVALDSIALSAADAPQMLGMDASDFGSQWSRVAKEVFDTGHMRNLALDILQETLSEDMLEHAAGFYSSPLGQRLVEVENAAHMIEDDEAKREEGQALVADGVAAGSERVSVLRELNDAIDSDGTGVRAVQEIQVRFLMAASNSGVLDWDLDEQTLRAMLKEDEAELRVEIQLSALASSAYTYQDMSLEDLRAYRDALEHPMMQRVYELMNAVHYEIMANRFEELAARMAKLGRGQEL